MMRVELVYFDAGGGHRAAAQALEQGMLLQGRRWLVCKTDLTDVLDAAQTFRRLTGMAPEDLYNKRLASGFTLGLAQELKLLQGLIRLSHHTLVQRLVRHFEVTRPDLVVSLIPNFNRTLHDALALARPSAPFVTVLTDMADHPPNFWIEPGCAQHVVCGSEHAAAQALAAGCHPRYVHRSSGMVLRPEFHLAPPTDRAAARRALGLDVDEPLALLLFGGTGSKAMLRIAERLHDVPLILLCGRNAALADAIRASPPAASSAPRIVLGHTPDVAQWMRLADAFIGKPGPGSLSEAVQCGLPVIVTCNAWTLPQERWNAEWVRAQRVGLVERSFQPIRAAVHALWRDLPRFRENVQRIQNRAVFEVPEILERILAQRPRTGPIATERMSSA